jgi:Tfp pilus assembly protein PilV
MLGEVLFTGRHLRRRERDEGGFGMIELLAAMTVMLIGIFAVFSLFQAGIVQIRRASTVTTAAALADAEMEKFRAIKYDSIGLANADVDSTVAGSYGSTYTGQTFYKTDTAASTTLSGSGITSTSQLTVPVQATVTGFPSSGPFVVKIDNEYMLINSRSTSTWSVFQSADRGLFGSTAATHSAGATVYWVQRVNVTACGTSPCTIAVPTKSVTGADGRSYKVDTYITWKQITNAGSTAGRLVKLVTVVVRSSSSPYPVWAKLSASFDEGTGL